MFSEGTRQTFFPIAMFPKVVKPGNIVCTAKIILSKQNLLLICWKTSIIVVCIIFINNKLSLVGMQLPEKYKENFERRPFVWSNSPHIFQVVASLPTKAYYYCWYYLHWHRQFKNKGLLTEREVCTVKYQTEVFQKNFLFAKQNLFPAMQINDTGPDTENTDHSPDMGFYGPLVNQSE
jgi:hypothetical protein